MTRKTRVRKHRRRKPSGGYTKVREHDRELSDRNKKLEKIEEELDEDLKRDIRNNPEMKDELIRRDRLVKEIERLLDENPDLPRPYELGFDFADFSISEARDLIRKYQAKTDPDLFLNTIEEDRAKELWKLTEVYGIDDEGHEALIESEADFQRFDRFALERQNTRSFTTKDEVLSLISEQMGAEDSEPLTRIMFNHLEEKGLIDYNGETQEYEYVSNFPEQTWNQIFEESWEEYNNKLFDELKCFREQDEELFEDVLMYNGYAHLPRDLNFGELQELLWEMQTNFLKNGKKISLLEPRVIKEKPADMTNPVRHLEQDFIEEGWTNYEYMLWEDDDRFILDSSDHANIDQPVNIFEYYGIDREAFRGTPREKKQMINALAKEFGLSYARSLLEEFKV